MLWLKSKNEFDEIWIKIDKTVEFFADHIPLITWNYLVKSFFIICQKKRG